MIIPSYIKHDSFIPIEHAGNLRVHDDRLVFRLKSREGWTNVKRTVVLRGSWMLEDKIIKHACDSFESAAYPTPRGMEWFGPFIDSYEDVKVNLPPWESYGDYTDVLTYLSNVRKHYWAVVDTHAGIKNVIGKAKDVEEFKHLYLDIEEQKRIIELNSV